MLLALLPAFALFWLLWRSKLSQGVWTTVCDEALLPYLLKDNSAKPLRGQWVIGCLTVCLAVVALAGPTWRHKPMPAFRNASAMVIVLDLSKSMDAEDIKPSRLIRARYKIADLLKQRKDGQTALLVYAGAAFTVTPLTNDTQTIASQLPALTTQIMPGEGDNLAEAFEKAVALFKQAGLQTGQIVLVTDGAGNQIDLSIAKQLGGYQLSVLGVGTPEGAPIPEAQGGFAKDASGSIIIPKLKAAELSQLAQLGQGIYQAITDNDSDVQNLSATLDRPLSKEGGVDTDVVLDLWADQGPWLLLAVLPLAALGFRKGVLVLLIFVLAPFPKNSYAFEWQDLWQTPDQQAQQKYRQQQFSEAAKQFNDPQWQGAAHYQAGEYEQALKAYQSAPQAGNADYFYNQGNALARSGQLEQAVKAYDQALAIKPDDSDAQFNKDAVVKALEQKKQPQQQNPEKSPDEKTGDKDQQQHQQNSEGDRQKPEAKPERHPGQDPGQQNDSQGPEERDPPKQEPQKTADDSLSKAEEAKAPDKQTQTQKQPLQTQESVEQKQAIEGWLNRIPDDPAGLLKRKFKYQYNQRKKAGDGDD